MSGHPHKPNSPYNHLSMQEVVDIKRTNRMASIDKLPPDIRSLIHEYGYNVVKSIYDVGVVKPKQIRHIVETVLNEFSPTRGTFSKQGIRGEKIDPSARS